MGDALDELVGLFEAEEAFGNSGDEDEEDHFSKYAATNSSTNFDAKTKEAAERQQKLTYRDLFGSPIKTKSKFSTAKSDSDESGENQDVEGVFATAPRRMSGAINALSVAPANERSKFSDSMAASLKSSYGHGATAKTSGGDTQLKWRTESVPNSNFNILLDPNSKLRLVKHSINIYFDELTPVEKSLKDRNINVEFIPLGNSAITTSKNFWTTGVLVRKVGLRQSSKGNNYGIWEINDFRNLEHNWTVFLFGTAATSPEFERIGVGSVIDLVNPSILDDAQTSSSSKKGIKFSVHNPIQVRLIGKAQDFGYCEARKKDGSPCKVPVNASLCPVCIHHASGELRKSLRKSKGQGQGQSKKNGFTKSKSFNFDEDRQRELEWKRRKNEGVATINFLSQPIGKSGSNQLSSFASLSRPQSQPAPNPARKLATRMELQDSSGCVKRTPIQRGNHSSITFRQDNSTTLEMPKCDLAAAQKKQEAKKALVLDPQKHRHLTEKDRKILETLSGGSGAEKAKPELSGLKVNPKILETDLASIVAKSTNAGARNVLQYFNSKSKADEIKKKNEELAARSSRVHVDGGPLVMTRETLSNMKAALNYVKQCGPIKKTDPNAVPRLKPRNTNPAVSASALMSSAGGAKRKREDEDDSGQDGSKAKISNVDKETPSSSAAVKAPGLTVSKTKQGAHLNLSDLLKDKNTPTSKLLQNEEILQLLHAKSAHAKLAEDIKEEEYFNKLERREAVENKLLSTYTIPTSAVMCKECKYIAVGRSDFCKEQGHSIKIVQANKRFFKCKDCGQRTMSLDRLPNRSCTNCKSSSWIPTSVGKERAGPKLESEMLAVRGDEEKFLGSSSSKLFLNL